MECASFFLKYSLLIKDFDPFAGFMVHTVLCWPPQFLCHVYGFHRRKQLLSLSHLKCLYAITVSMKPAFYLAGTFFPVLVFSCVSLHLMSVLYRLQEGPERHTLASKCSVCALFYKSFFSINLCITTFRPRGQQKGRGSACAGTVPPGKMSVHPVFSFK